VGEGQGGDPEVPEQQAPGGNFFPFTAVSPERQHKRRKQELADLLRAEDQRREQDEAQAQAEQDLIRQAATNAAIEPVQSPAEIARQAIEQAQQRRTAAIETRDAIAATQARAEAIAEANKAKARMLVALLEAWR
jgi:hypothetical protein